MPLLSFLFPAEASMSNQLLNNFQVVHKRGDTFDRQIIIPAEIPDGFFVGWTPYAQIKTARYGAFIAAFTCEWEDATTTRILRLRDIQTIDWPEGNAVMDVQFVRNSDGSSLSTQTIDVTVIRDVTTPTVTNLGIPI